MSITSTKNELSTVKALVHSILEQDERARNSDGYLYLKVIEQQAHQKGEDIRFLTVAIFFDTLHETGFAKFESVRRARQKLQQEFPHLSANRNVKAFRDENESVYRNFARGVI